MGFARDSVVFHVRNRCPHSGGDLFGYRYPYVIEVRVADLGMQWLTHMNSVVDRHGHRDLHFFHDRYQINLGLILLWPLLHLEIFLIFLVGIDLRLTRPEYILKLVLNILVGHDRILSFNIWGFNHISNILIRVLNLTVKYHTLVLQVRLHLLYRHFYFVGRYFLNMY